MADALTVFATLHNEAFLSLGASKPGQHWSAFDVTIEHARAGRATRLVTTIWNYHSIRDGKGRRIPAEPGIAKDWTNGTLWYRFRRSQPGSKGTTRSAHWSRLELALDRSVRIIGVLKDVHSGRCSLSHIFDCGNRRTQIDGSAMWLQLKPRGEVGCEVREIDIDQLTLEGREPAPLAKAIQQFEVAVQDSQQLSGEERLARLASAPRLPKRIEVTSTVFDRNPHVVAEVLVRARGLCGLCNSPAPFARRSDGSPYLEVHHRISLANGGEDTVANAVALCPNCHRAAHYG